MFQSPTLKTSSALSDLQQALGVTRYAEISATHVAIARERKLSQPARLLIDDVVRFNEHVAARPTRLRQSLPLLEQLHVLSTGPASARQPDDIEWPRLWLHRADPRGYGDPRPLNHNLQARAVLLARVSTLIDADPKAPDAVAVRRAVAESVALVRVDDRAVIDAATFDGGVLGVVVADPDLLAELIARVTRTKKSTRLEQVGITFA